MFGPDAVQIINTALVSKKVMMAITGPQDSTFRVRSGSGSITHCLEQKGMLVASAEKAEKSSLPNSVQHYTLACPVRSGDKKLTLLIHSKLGAFEYDYETTLITIS